MMKHKGLAIVLFALVFLTISQSFAQKTVFYFSLNGEIDPRTERHCALALEKAKEEKPDLVLMELNTFGGMLNSADSMRRMILDFPIPMVVWINKNAASAGALISLACDSIYMNDGASIGAASVVNGEGQVMPGKYQSYMRSLMRSTAKANGRDPEIAEQMVYVFQDSGETEKQVITLTTEEAIDKGFCEGVAKSKEEVVELYGISDYSFSMYTQSTTERIISFFINPAVSSILLLMILGGIYFELQSPGIGFALIIAVIGAVFYFVPYYLNGLAENWELALLAVGFLLIVLEVLVIPGFGVAGLLGIVFSLTSLVLIMLNNDFLDFTFVPSGDVMASLISVLTACFLFIIVLFFGGVKFTQTAYFKRVSLQTTLAESDADKQAKQEELAKGSIAITVGPLRPGGKIEAGGKLYEAVTAGDYIPANMEVEVLERTMNTWKVRKKA